MLAKIGSAAVHGLSAVPIEVEVDVASTGLPSFTIVGLPDQAVSESKERVRTAIKNSGADFPTNRITVNLAPAHIPKVGPAYDLPIALGILVGSGQIQNIPGRSLYIGELSLDGSLRHTKGILPITEFAREAKIKRAFIPKDDACEAGMVSGVDIFPVESLMGLVRHINSTDLINKTKKFNFKNHLGKTKSEFDFSEIVGQESAKRALEVAASGGHNILMKGSPGSGKTMLARALPGILPIITEGEALEITKIYSVAGLLPSGKSLITSRPFRSPHHTTSMVGLIGGGTKGVSPGEVTFAHRGVLFLDEFPEFSRTLLESLRQPLEDGFVTITRSKSRVVYPSNFILVAAANPCPCGYLNDHKHVCSCEPGQIGRYQKRISGPILDRIDIHIDVPSVETQKLISQGFKAETSEEIQKRVQKARNLQLERFEGTKIKSNADMKSKEVKQYCYLDSECISLLKSALATLKLSARSYFKVVKVARTIADLGGSEQINTNHIAESLQYRPGEV